MSDDTIKELINRRRHQILVHSCIYYRLDQNLIPDYVYDQWSKELAELQQQYPELAKEVPLYEEFKDFDGSSGFDLPIHDPRTVAKAEYLVDLHRHYVKEQKT